MSEHTDAIYSECLRAIRKARLLAVASEMLAALEDAKEELICLYERVYPSDDSANDTTATIDRVIAVIAKARGEKEED